MEAICYLLGKQKACISVLVGLFSGSLCAQFGVQSWREYQQIAEPMDLVGGRLQANGGPPTLWADVFYRICGAALLDAVPLLIIEVLPGFAGEVFFVPVEEVTKFFLPSLIAIGFL